MTEYTVHYQKGSRVGARSLRMETVLADSVMQALKAAPRPAAGYKLVRVDHYDEATGRLVIDY